MKKILFYENLQIDNDTNFISSVVTPWQIQGTLANINYLQNRGVIVKGILIINEHGITGKCIKEEDLLPFKDYNIKIYYSRDLSFVEKIKNRLERLFYFFNTSSNDNPIYVLNFGVLATFWKFFLKNKTKRDAVYILGDDGTGAYNGYKGLIKTNVFRELNKNIEYRIFKNKTAIIDNRLLGFSNGKLVCNKDVAKLYVELFKKHKVETSILNDFNGKIIINSQCLFDNHEIFGSQDIDTFNILFESLGNKNEDVILKPHPREISLSRYDCFKWKVCDRQTITQEEIFANIEIPPRAIIGITSSTLINLNILFGVKTISLAKIFNKYSLPLGMKKDVEDFIRLYEDFVLMPSNVDELKKLLSTI